MVDRGSFSFKNNLTFVDERVRSHAPVSKNVVLPEGWTPSPWSVLCGRGKDCFEAIGNRRFRILVEANLEKYASATSKLAKSIIVMGVLDAIREGSNQIGGFVKQDPKTKRWVEVNDDVSREKIGQQFRVALAQRKNKKNNKTTAEQGKRVSKSKMAAKRRRVSTCSASSSSSSSCCSSVEPIIVESQNVSTSTQEEETIVRPVSPEPVSSSIIINEEKELDTTPTPMLDDIANVLEFELDCNDDELLHIIAVTA